MKVVYLARLREALGRAEERLSLSEPEGHSVADVIGVLRARGGVGSPSLRRVAALRCGQPRDARLARDARRAAHGRAELASRRTRGPRRRQLTQVAQASTTRRADDPGDEVAPLPAPVQPAGG